MGGVLTFLGECDSLQAKITTPRHIKITHNITPFTIPFSTIIAIDNQLDKKQRYIYLTILKRFLNTFCIK